MSDIFGTTGDDSLNGTLDADNIFADAGNDTVFGDEGDDLILGGADNDMLSGGLGDDALEGEGGDDYLRGNAGVDGYDGGDGDDRVSFFDRAATQGVIANLITQTIGNDGFGNVETMVSVEGLGGGTAFADSFTGDDNANMILAENGDTVIANGGDDSFQLGGAPALLDGGAGIDTLSVFVDFQLIPDANADGLAEIVTTTTGVIVNLATQTIVNDGFGGSGIIQSVENVGGGAFNDQIIGDGQNNTLNGFFGDDAIDGGAGEDVVQGGPGNDLLGGEAANDQLFGGDDQDELRGGAGDDLLDGGLGWDTANYSLSEDGVVVDLRVHVAQDTGAGGVDTLVSVERVVGGNFGDTLIGDDQDNALYGVYGDDFIDGGGGIDFLFGQDGADTAFGGAGDDIIEGGEAFDFLVGGDDNDQVFGDAGDDALVGGPGDDTLDGGDGWDYVGYFDAPGGVIVDLTLQGSAQNTGAAGVDTIVSVQNVEGGAFNDVLTGDDQANRIWGGFGEDEISLGEGLDEAYGEDGADILHGGADYDALFGEHDSVFDEVGIGWNDQLSGGDGDDYMRGGNGDDLLDGGDGFDRVSFYSAPLGVTVNLTIQGVAQDTVGAGVDTLVDVENVSGSQFADTLIGNDGDNWLWTHGGADIVSGAGGDDTIQLPHGDGAVVDGGAGVDVVTFTTNDPGGATATPIMLDLGVQGAAQNTGTQGLVTLSNIEGAEGSEANDTIAGNGAANILSGLSGADDVNGWSGNDVIHGDLPLREVGETFFDYENSPIYVHGDDVLNGGDGNDQIYGDGGDDVIDGGSGFDQITGGRGADALMGGGGQDTFFQGIDTSVDTIAGGDGHDLLNYSAASAGVVVQLSGYATTTGGATLALLSGIESAQGSAFNDTLVGSAANNVLIGGAGSDWLVGGGGDDTFAQGGEAGVDRLFGDAGTDTIDFGIAGAGVTVQLSGYATTSGGALLATFNGIEDAVGSFFNDALIGNAGANRITGRAGSDWLVGAGGDDWFIQGTEGGVDRLFGDAGLDTIDYSLAGASVTVQLSGYSTTGAATLATFTGIENAVGSAFDDALIGNGANNRITGGAGSDWLVGQNGDDWFVQGVAGGVDRLFGDAGLDTIDYSSAGAGVTVQLSGYATSAGVTLATFTGIENAVGTALNDALIGNAGDNRITGGAGADWLVGGGGNDTFMQGLEGGGVDRLFGDAGTDTIDYSGAAAGVTVQLSGYAANGGTTLATFTGIENAVGTAFNDALIGDASNNRLTGGTGGDWLVGGGGTDTFVYQSIIDGAGDSIRDFSRTDLDRIDLSAIDANLTTGADDAFIFSTTRHAGVLGEVVLGQAVVTSVGAWSFVSLYLDGDNVADMTVQVLHASSVVLNAGDFVL